MTDKEKIEAIKKILVGMSFQDAKKLIYAVKNELEKEVIIS